MKTITIQEMKKLAATGDGIDLIDVRTPAEYAGCHATGAKLYPLDGLNCREVLAQRQAAGQPLYILCHSGTRAKKAAQMFDTTGFENGVVVEGGTEAWIAAGLPVVRGERAVLPLDRQLQITIGVLVLTGVLLAWLVNPAWIWLSGFVGAGLIFAGISGICMMRSLLARMPWNQTGAASKSCCSQN